MRPLRLAGALRVAEGMTVIDEVAPGFAVIGASDACPAGKSTVCVWFGRMCENWPECCCTNGFRLNNNSMSIR